MVPAYLTVKLVMDNVVFGTPVSIVSEYDELVDEFVHEHGCVDDKPYLNEVVNGITVETMLQNGTASPALVIQIKEGRE